MTFSSLSPQALRHHHRSIRSRIGLLLALFLSVQGLSAQPLNDLCSAAVPIACGSITPGTTVNADWDPDAEFCDVGPMAPGVWYMFTGVNGAMVLSTCQASYSTILNLYTGACGSMVCVAGNLNDGTCENGSRIVFEADPQQTYFVLVNGFFGGTGDFDLSLQPQDGGCAPLRAFLDGPFDPGTGLMSDSLRTRPDFPLTEPYTALGYAHVGGGGGESISPSVLLASGPDAIVDWVVIELRDPVNPGKRIASFSALVQRDGDVVGLDGTSPLQFGSFSGSYFLALRHRNHLGVMSASPLSFPSAQWDITAPGQRTWGTDSRKTVGDVRTLWSGDVSFDGEVKYVGAGNDRDPILQAIGGNTPTNTATGYGQTDVDLSGTSSYVGAGNDRDPILVSIGGSVPTNTRRDFLPAELQFHEDIHIYIVDSTGWVLDSAQSDLPSGLYSFAFTGATPVVIADDIVVGGTAGQYLRKVTSASVAGNTIALQTVQGSLADVIAEGVLNFNIPMSGIVTDDAPQFLAPASPGLNLSVTDVALFHVGGVILPDADEQALVIKKGSIHMNPDIQMSFDYDPIIGLRNAEFSTRGSTLTAEAILSTKITASIDTTIEHTLGQWSKLSLFVVPVAGVPFPIWVEWKIEVAAEAELKLAGVLSTVDTISTVMACDMGMRYNYGVVEPMFNNTATFNVGGELTELSGTMGIKMTFEEKISANLYTVLGPFISASSPEVNARGTASFLTGDSDLSVKASIKLETGIQLTSVSNSTALVGGGLWESDSLFWRTPNRMVKLFGDHQVDQPDSTLTDSLAVLVLSTLGVPQKNVKVHFAIKDGDGTLSAQEVLTNDDGIARCSWTLGPEGQPLQRVKAWARFGNGDTLVDGPLYFDAEFQRLQAMVWTGDDQVARQGEELPAPIVVRVADQEDVPAAGVMVHFEVAGGGSLSSDSIATDTEGLANCTWTLGTNGLDQQLVRTWATNAQYDTLPPGILTFSAHFPYNYMDYADSHDFSGDVGDDMPPMRVIVLDQLGLPQSNIVVHFEIVTGGGTLSQSLAFTDAQGIATSTWNLGLFTAHTQVVKAWSLDLEGDTLQGAPLYFSATEPGQCSMLSTPSGTPTYGDVLDFSILATGVYTGIPLDNYVAGFTAWRGANVPNPGYLNATGPDGVAFGGWSMVAYNTGGQHARLVCFGDTMEFNTTLPNCTGTMEDVDGNSYPIGWVGNRCVMLKNLRTTHFTDGGLIPFGTDAEWEGSDTTEQALVAHVNNDTVNDEDYGLLYNFYAAQDRRNTTLDTLCPLGWHIPTTAYFDNVPGEWSSLIDVLGGVSLAGGKMKATTLWDPPNTGASNTTGFTAFPAGSRTPSGPQDMGQYARFWVDESTLFGNAYFMQLWSDSEAIWTEYTSRKNGLSCRCFRSRWLRDME